MNYYIGEIRIFPHNHIPNNFNWVPCNGQALKIKGNESLHSLLGSKFGGDGKTEFCLPNLNGRAIIGDGDYTTASGDKIKYLVGQIGGSEGVALTSDNMPAHNHKLYAINNYQSASPSSNFIGNPNIPNGVQSERQNKGTVNIYAPLGKETTISPGSISTPKTGKKHENRMPFLPIVYCICTGDAAYPPKE
jgi:microcystin-dependent protein